MEKGAKTIANGLWVRARALACASAMLLTALPGPVQAQVGAHPVDPFAADQIVDFREQMRNLIQSISAYGRTLNPGFVVVADGGLALVGKPDPLDPDRVFPASAYGRAIDGVMERELLDETVTTPEGKLDPNLQQAVERRKADLERAGAMALTIFDLEFDTQPGSIDKKYQDAEARGFVPYVAPGADLIRMADHPASAFRANPNSLTALKAAKNFVSLSSAQGFGTTDDYIRALRGTNFDVVVVDVFANGTPLTAQQVDLLKYKKLGSRRLVLAQINVATAAPFQYFWQAGWGPGNPPFLYAPIRNDPDRTRVLYWDAGWHAILYGGTNSYVYGVWQLGFDGVVLTGVDAWRFFEGGGDQP